MTKHIILLFSFFLWTNAFGQIDKIKIKKQDSSGVVLSIAKMTDGIITVANLMKDPVLRLEYKGNKKYTLKKYVITFNINGVIDEYSQGNVTKLNTKQLKLIRSSKKDFENKLFIEQAIAVDESGNEFVLNRIRLKIKV